MQPWKIAVVMPCYNEATRLPASRIGDFLRGHPDVGLVPVDDGSTDDTSSRLEELAAEHSGQVEPLRLEANSGKAEAVRRGMLRALERGAPFAGYFDADLATPLGELPRFVDLLEERPEVLLAMGSRVALVGRDIVRSKLRHYVGRVFATFAARTLQLRVYDTQCGAKVLRNTEITQSVFAKPFCCNWAFDVELIARILLHDTGGDAATGERRVYEIPLDTWHDVAGGKVRPLDLPRSLLELRRIRKRYPGLEHRE